MSKEAMKLALEALTFDGFTPEDATHRSIHAEAIKALEEALAKQEQGEPVAYLNPDDVCADTAFRWCKIDEFTQPVYTTPQQRTWVGLTTGETAIIVKMLEKGNLFLAIAATEAKLREKNT